MIKRIHVLANNQEEALSKGAKILKVSENYLYATFLGEIYNLGNYEILLDVNLELKGREYLLNIVRFFDPLSKVTSRHLNDQSYSFLIDTSATSLLIGRGGETLSALQVLLKKFLQSFTSDKLIISLDVGGYKEVEKARLISLAKKVARDVERTRIPVKLDPMNPYKRHIIHEAIQHNKHVKTESEGFGNRRAVVIKPR